jgi:glycosyltransferase involved in cell wall biosynthesis
MRVAFVVQRYGLDIAGGAEYHCRLVAEHLARHLEVEVLTTCAADYITWANRYPAGTETLNGVRVRRFPVTRPREAEAFAAWSARVFGPEARVVAGRVDPAVAESATTDEALRWIDEQGPVVPALVRFVADRREEYDAFVFFSYRYYPTFHGLCAAGDRALLVPTAEDDGVYRLPVFAPFFRQPRAVVFNSPEERSLIESVAGSTLAGEVVGVGSELPDRLDPEAFRGKTGLADRFLLYVGRIDVNKGCVELFDHFRRYRAETGSSLRLVLVGTGVLDVPDDPGIVALGFRSDEDKWNALRAAEAFVMPSRLESLSMATLEAFWAERPVLANAKCAVLRGQCRRAQAGLYYATYDEFREVLALLEADAGLRQVLGRNGRRYFEANYAWPVVEGKYLDLLARVREPERVRA